MEPNHHGKCSVVGALDLGKNELRHECRQRRLHVGAFLDDVIQQGDGTPTVIVLDNASIHHGIDVATRNRWLIDHQALLFDMPTYSPELNKIEIIWRQLKYRWRRFVTWTKETIDTELADLLNGYGKKDQTSFS
ncbi:transposase [Burkholderia territorii]|uniref:Transposase n=1 Tax=Burkholderia territorii TaxID=1503055 RepID=A0A108E6F8_9BURK|nr:transposase [Burkholderia territorii]KWN05610.1 transposase [Burkholderia territorii]